MITKWGRQDNADKEENERDEVRCVTEPERTGFEANCRILGGAGERAGEHRQDLPGPEVHV